MARFDGVRRPGGSAPVSSAGAGWRAQTSGLAARPGTFILPVLERQPSAARVLGHRGGESASGPDAHRVGFRSRAEVQTFFASLSFRFRARVELLTFHLSLFRFSSPPLSPHLSFSVSTSIYSSPALTTAGVLPAIQWFDFHSQLTGPHVSGSASGSHRLPASFDGRRRGAALECTVVGAGSEAASRSHAVLVRVLNCARHLVSRAVYAGYPLKRKGWVIITSPSIMGEHCVF